MENGNGGASDKGGVLVPVSVSSDAFHNNVLAPLKSAYLFEESKQSFRYKSAVLIKNPSLEKKYNAFRAKRREAGYSEEDLKESYGFLLFDDVNKANTLGESGVLTGNSTCTTLGDPSKGVYISMYSDCLDLNRWYHGKSGYIAIIRLTKGRVNKVLENYTQNLTAPTEGFDCHASEQLPSVSAKTSSFLAFERTQYYMYELLDDRSNETVQSPSAAFPIAIVSFSYTDTKATVVAPPKKSEDKKLVCHYSPWRGQLQIGTHFYDVGLRSTAGALIPAELPPVVKVDRAISMLDLKQLLPKAVFETCFSGEVFLEGLYCSLFEFVSSEAEETSSLSLLLWEIKEKDIALSIPLNDGGFLVLLHSSHFLTYDDAGSSAAEVLQGMFVFPDSRVIQRDTKFGQRKPVISSEILRVLPVLSYAEAEVEKTPSDPSEDLCDVYVQHMQSYAALINPGFTSSPSRDISIFPDQYDVPDAHKHLYSSPEWTNRAWQNFRSYLSKPVSFQLPVSEVSEILVAGQEDRIEDLDDDVYFCLSSPEEATASDVGMGSGDQLTGQKFAVNVETSVESCITSAEAEADLKVVTHNVIPSGLQAGNATKDTEKSDLTVLIKTDDMGTKNLLTPSTSDDLPAELIVSITSAEQTVTDASLSVISTESAAKHNDFQFSGFSTDKLQTAGMNSLSDETVETKKDFDRPEHTNLIKTKRRKPHRGHSKGQKQVSTTCIETYSLQTMKTQLENDNVKSQKDDQAKESSGHLHLSRPSNIDWRKVRRRKRVFGKLSSKQRKLRSATVGVVVAQEKKSDRAKQSFESTVLMELEACPLRKKTERWDLKPVISECGRILVPHGSVDIADQIKTLKDKLQSSKDEQCPEKMLVEVSGNAHDAVKMEQESSTAPETILDETATPSKGGENLLLDPVNPEHSILRKSDDCNDSLILNQKSSEQSIKNDGADTSPLQTVQEKLTDSPSRAKSATKGELLLNKLKSVLLRGKRKTGILVSTEKAADTTQDIEPCLKKGKVDSDSAMLKSNDAVTSVKDTSVDVKEVSKMISVDPVFAYALGLTPKETPDMIQKSEGQGTQQRKDPSETEGQTMLDKQPQIIQRPLSIFPRRSRIKTLKKHQGISAECVKKKWWLHFQTPACFASEKLKCKEFTRDNSVRKTVKEKSSSACSSTDALNLLADLALGASNDQVPPQPDPALERKPETSLKKCDLTKDVTSAEQESVLHALLRQPAARPIQPLESPSPSHLMGGSELVDLVSKEHDYSLPPSSSLLLGLSGAPFPVSPLSGSTRLLHHHQTMYGDGIKILHPSVDQEDRSSRRRKFRNSRTFVNKNGSVQVTKLWKENYDFNLDSKFTSDSKDKSIIRALHGPWDFSIQDTNEEVRLIFHMWIGLFYSRSTARFFHIDSNCTNPCSEESDSLEMSSAMVPSPAQSDLRTNSFGPTNVTDTSETLISKALDLRKKDNSVLDQGSVILDLSLRSSNPEIVTPDLQIKRKETSVSEQREASQTLETLEPSVRLQKGSTLQCYSKSALSTETINEVNDVRRPYESKMTCASWQMVGHLEHTDIPSFKSDGGFISGQKEMENHQITSGTVHVFHGSNSEKTDVKDGIENSQAAELSLVKEWEGNSAKPPTDKEVDSNKKTGDVVDTIEDDETESKNGENWNMKEKSYLEDNIELSPKISHAGAGSSSVESGIVCNGNLLENEKHLSMEEPKAVSPDKAENINEDVDCCTVHEDVVVKDDHLGKADERDEKGCRISDDSDLNDQPLPGICDGPDLEKRDCITECNRHAPLDEQPSQADNEEDLCMNIGALTDQLPISEKASEAPSEVEPIHNEPAVEENSENYVCMADLSYHPLPMTFDGPDSVKKNSITECNPQAPLVEETPQAGIKKEACHESKLRKLCANSSELTNEHSISKNVPQTPSEIKPILNEPAVKENSQSYICLADEAHYQKASLPLSDESTCSLDASSADGSVRQTSDRIMTGSQNKEMANFSLSSDDHDTKSVDRKQNVDNTTQKEQFYQSHSTQRESATKCKPEVVLTKETDKTSKGLGKIHSRVVIPFIGIDTSGEDAIQPHDSDSEGEVEEVPRQKEIPFIRETTYPEIALPPGACNTSQKCSKKAEPSAGKISLSLLNVSETNQPQVSGSESDDRCPTPTMDEEPYQYLNCSSTTSSSSSPAFTASETCKNKSKVNSDSHPHHGLPPDLQLRTLRVLQSIDKFLPRSRHNDKSSQIETFDMKQSLDRTPNISSRYISTCSTSNHTSVEFKDKKTVVSVPTSQDLCTESSGHFIISPFKTKLEEILGVRMQLKHTDSSIQQHYFDRTDKLQENSAGQNYCHPHRSSSTECLQDTKPNIDQDRHKTMPQTSLSHESRLYNQRPVMAVKPSKSDEIQADSNSKDRETDDSEMSLCFKTELTKASVVTYNTPASMLFEKKSESLKGNSAEVNDDQQDASEPCSKTSWLLNVGDSKSNLNKAKFAFLEPSYQYEGRDISKFNKICSSSLPVQSLESAKTSSNLADGNQSFLTNSLLENVGHTTKEIIEMDQKDCSEASTSAAYYKDDSTTDDALFLGPQSTLTCTVYNTSRKRSHSFLEQLSQRCLQDDLTQASMEQECLIFSEQMKQVLKRSKREHTHRLEARDKLNLSFSGPLTVHFSSLEEQEDLVDHLDAPSLVGQKIKVDMSDRKDLANTTEEKNTLYPQKLCQGTGNPFDHAGVSAVSAECARLYTAMMNDVCAVKRIPSKHFRKDKGYIKTEPSNHFDFCDQMKREMDESFRNDLNSVVKKSCKTKYRFFILSTSDDTFFEETKAQLEAEGHTAVQPSEFFLAEDSSSSLLIIVKNEDIAEHICEVPHLLELKKSSHVQFAGIDEPDDVVNLTHQELFMRGGFIMFDKATLESLSLCNMKKMSEILQELSRTGKWKWMLHYRDSRRLKENARLSAEAKEKKHFLNWCQEVGILDIMPYHECDLMSRDQPDYLTCMIRLQVQTISARYPVFITDTTTDEAFGKNGILTMTLSAFLTCTPSETFTV